MYNIAVFLNNSVTKCSGNSYAPNALTWPCSSLLKNYHLVLLGLFLTMYGQEPMSLCYSFHYGVPQGLILGPLLFAIYTFFSPNLSHTLGHVTIWKKNKQLLVHIMVAAASATTVLFWWTFPWAQWNFHRWTRILVSNQPKRTDLSLLLINVHLPESNLSL